MDNSLHNLEKIGLTDKESRVYLAALELGRSTVSAISERAQVNRSTTYVILRRLRAQGFVLEIPHTKKHEFIAEDPAKLVSLSEERLITAERLVPTLRARQKKDSDLSNIRFYQGVAGIREAYAYRLESLKGTECVAFFGSSQNLPVDVHAAVRKWYRDSKRLDIQVRAIAPDDKGLSEYRDIDTEYKREVHVISHNLYPSTLSIEIFPDIVRMISLTDLQTIIIESKETAVSMKAIFEICWAQTL